MAGVKAAVGTHLYATILSALWGGLAVAVLLAIGLIAIGDQPRKLADLWLGFGALGQFAAYAFFFAFIAFLLGALTLGLPTRLLLQRLGLASPAAAMAVGALVSTGVAIAVLDHDGVEWLFVLFAIAVAGSIAGYSYLRATRPEVKPPPAPPA